jgi:transcriptional regulator with XRE-family HTH domain
MIVQEINDSPMKQSNDFNNIREWLQPLLNDRKLSVETFARMIDVTRTAVYNYMNDANRPDVETMVRMCKVLQRPLEEGLATYTPRHEGRPFGFSPGGQAELRPKRRATSR